MEPIQTLKATVYLETTIVSYLTARPNRDLIVAANQEITRQWWEFERHKFHCCVSPYVIDEASVGDSEAAKKRIDELHDIEVLPLSPEIESIAEKISFVLKLPIVARMDAFHLACVIFHRIDYLLTWNCSHLANGPKLKQLSGLLQAESLWQPLVYTPNEMIQST